VLTEELNRLRHPLPWQHHSDQRSGRNSHRSAFVTADRYPVGTVLCVQDKEMKQAWCLAASSTGATSRALMRL